MTELTTIINAQITVIGKVTDERASELINKKEEFKQLLETEFSKKFEADDVNVNIQHFVLEEK